MKFLEQEQRTFLELTPLQQRLHTKLKRDLGMEFLNALNDPTTVEIMLNADGTLWQERLGKPMQSIGHINANRAESILRTMATCLNTTITADKPTLEGELPLDGSRFAGQRVPVVKAPTFSVRKKASMVFTLDQYVDQGIMTGQQHTIITEAIARRKNIVVIGGTGSGKTTLTNAIIQHMMAINPDERIVIIEDTGEIQCSAANFVQYHTTPTVDMTQLLKTTLRMRPDRILIGEVRGPEALDLLMAWNTGHEGGVATLHANNAQAGLARLATLISMHPNAPRAIEPLIGDVVHLLIHILKTTEGRRVAEIVNLAGYTDGHYQFQPL